MSASYSNTRPEVAVSDAMTLPQSYYTDPAWYLREMETIHFDMWLCAGRTSQIPQAGDYFLRQVANASVIITRDEHNNIRAFHNVCRHRGARLLDGSGNCPHTITCPYHGWTYRHDGALIGTPVRESFPGLNRAEHGLRPVRVDIAFGFVFVCLAGDPPPVSKVWGRLADELLPYRFEDMVPLEPISQETWPVDWKIAMDNYLESYHVPIGHPGLFRMFTPDYDDQASVPGVARGISWLREQESPRWAEGLYQRLIGKATAHLPEDQRRCWRFYSALPNLGMDVYPERMDFFQVLPDGPGRCIVRGAVFGLPDERREMRAIRYLSSRINTQVNNEDKRLCARVQRGLASSSYRPGPLSQLERWMFEFHNLLRERIPEFCLSHAPKQFA